MENIKKLLAVWGAAAVFFLGGIEAGAAGMGKLGMVSSETTVRKGQETEFRISLEAYEGISRGINAFMGTLAVSYTHLDVYKRQEVPPSS